ncbi:DUF6044 family protein [Bacillus sp. 03113]|uniref:DUF6044 family protein n=1 Tax=Bacillus sp. 03113 TaxID=2578211 RepID=UPI001C6563D4|nr:DUF6044 family protein [Bacillus sp. 03113]
MIRRIAKIKKQNKRSMLIGGALFIIIGWVAPYFILGENAHVRVQDNLDSNLGWYKVLKESGQLFGPLQAPIKQVMNGGLSRDSFYSQFYGMVVLFSIFPPMFAYGLCQLITRVVAFVGMYLLLKKHVIKKDDVSILTIGVSLTFSLTPYWPSGMLSILGMPIALWAFLNIRQGEKTWKNVMVLTCLPFLSTFVLGFFFFLAALGVWWLVDLIRTKKWNIRMLIALGYMTILYLAIDYRLVASMLIPGVQTNRSEFYESKLDLLQTLKLALKNYVLSHNQDMTVSFVIILPLSLYGLWIVLKNRSWKKEKLFIGLHLLNVLLSLWYAFWFYKGWQPLKEKSTLLTSFNFARFHYLRPVVIYVLFALSLKLLWSSGKRGKRVVIFFLIAQICVLIPFNEQVAYHNQPSYREYFAKKEFEEIKSYIDMPVDQYRVISIGIHPNIAQYNGFYTLDTYSNFYPLAYKHQFRKIIAPELDKNEKLEKYFDEWGGRCYVFVNELGKNYMYSKHSTKKINHLQLNTNQLKSMGGTYIFSAVPIENAQENHLVLEKVFQSKTSYWRIYLYRLN